MIRFLSILNWDRQTFLDYSWLTYFDYFVHKLNKKVNEKEYLYFSILISISILIFIFYFQFSYEVMTFLCYQSKLEVAIELSRFKIIIWQFSIGQKFFEIKRATCDIVDDVIARTLWLDSQVCCKYGFLISFQIPPRDKR